MLWWIVICCDLSQAITMIQVKTPYCDPLWSVAIDCNTSQVKNWQIVVSGITQHFTLVTRGSTRNFKLEMSGSTSVDISIAKDCLSLNMDYEIRIWLIQKLVFTFIDSQPFFFVSLARPLRDLMVNSLFIIRHGLRNSHMSGSYIHNHSFLQVSLNH